MLKMVSVAKLGFNKSFSDCAIAQFVDILHHQAQKLGVKILKINPKYLLLKECRKAKLRLN
jgi:hypothetical protein